MILIRAFFWRRFWCWARAPLLLLVPPPPPHCPRPRTFAVCFPPTLLHIQGDGKGRLMVGNRQSARGIRERSRSDNSANMRPRFVVATDFDRVGGNNGSNRQRSARAGSSTSMGSARSRPIYASRTSSRPSPPSLPTHWHCTPAPNCDLHIGPGTCADVLCVVHTANQSVCVVKVLWTEAWTEALTGLGLANPNR